MDDGGAHTFLVWGNGSVLSGAVVTATSGVFSHSAPQTYVSGIDQYHYAVAWLAMLNRFLLVVKTGDDSVACLVDVGGVASNCTTVDASIIREAQLGVRWMPAFQQYQVVYATGIRDVAVLAVGSTAIAQEPLIVGEAHPTLQGISWVETGIWATFVEDADGDVVWDDEVLALFGMNDDGSDGAVYVVVGLNAGIFPTSTSYLPIVMTDVLTLHETTNSP